MSGEITESAAPARETRAIRRVLIVDDSPAHTRLMAKMLERWGYDVGEAGSVAEALQRFGQAKPDLILSDWVMPEATGLDLCRAVRELPGGAYVYFILLTSKSAREDVATGLAAGADDFLLKPINADELRARISAGERLVALQRTLEERNAELAGTLDQLQAVYDGIARDLVEARNLQQSLVPERTLTLPGADVALLLRPSGQIGGDLVGAFPVSDSRVVIYAIDVSGHGIASALMTARLTGYLSGASPDHNVALEQLDDGTYRMRALSDICAHLNSTILADLETELYFTMVIADCDLATGRVLLAQAGHPHPLVQRRDGSVEFVGDGGMLVGLFQAAQYAAIELKLEPGDRLLLHSDGFTEATSLDDTMLDLEGFRRFVTDLADQSGEEFFETLVWKLADYTGRAEFEDDVSGVLLEFRSGVSAAEG